MQRASFASESGDGSRKGEEKKDEETKKGKEEVKEKKGEKNEKVKGGSSKVEKKAAPGGSGDTVAVSTPEDTVETEGITADETAVVRNRLEEHYYGSLLEDIMVMRYRHESAEAPSIEKVDRMLEQLRKAEDATINDPNPLSREASQRSDLLRVFSTPLTHLPTAPLDPLPSTVTNLLSKKAADARGVHRNVKRLWRRRLVNPIDYTTVRRSAMEAFLLGDGKEKDGAGFAPVPGKLPAIRKVVLKIWEDSAVQNKYVLLSAILSLQAITGVYASPLFAARGDASKKIRQGMPLGAVVELKGPRAYEFLDKLIQVVLPRLREWEGVDPFVVDTETGGSGAGSGRKGERTPAVTVQPGTITLRLPESVMGSFPDIEPHYEMYPRLFATTVTVHTTSKDLEGAAMVLSGFQMPFMKDAKPAETEKKSETEGEEDPYAKFRKRKDAGPRGKGGRK
ncbi:hypothetical protein HDU67_004322 [Dinochytrium kinnereticum]|nr:hypothetical protein HDU67_004322 [Dinochytrium kinnereticum]